MSDRTQVYRRLSGSGMSAFQRVSLYLGADHLLLVTSSGYTESYKRFYFADIQAITLRKSFHGKVWNAIWGVLFMLATLLAANLDGVALTVWSGIAALFLTGLFANVALGSTCACQIRTAVQAHPLGSLNRWRRAGKAITQLRPILEAAQRPLSMDEMRQRLEEARRNPSLATSASVG